MGSKKIIAIIPARGASKSVKNKNLKKVLGKTLVKSCFDVLKKSKNIDDIFCTSEAKNILNHCKKIGLNSIKRPEHLSIDNSQVFYCVEHVLKSLHKSKNLTYDYVILAQPTSPLITLKQVDDLIKIIKFDKKLSSVQTIHETPHNYHFLNTRIVKKNHVSFKFKKQRILSYNKQKKEKTYSFGNLCIVKVKKLLKTKNFFSEPSGFLEIDRLSSFDFDNKFDFDFFEKISLYAKK